MAAAEPEETDASPLSLKDLELQTFNTNFRSLSQEECLEEASDVNPLKIICVGDYTGGVRTKGVFVKDYLGIKPTLEVIPSHMERFSAMTKVYTVRSFGVWGPHNSSSLDGAVQWRKKNNEEVSLPIPCVLVTDNVADSCVKSVNWIGPGFESEVALDEFCKDHGFLDHL
ncbi:rab32, member RAS oncoprotein [Desmophyllum pertusum]|uniref:Rab32, member RAS oncoprotein n=1 Tax=Desmophyllum pertusum TaxID=174260 RepID=A0A9X0CNX7_9CNID|nr:rab32, member RAS oncoprotein [Desmophyllum pertusum]